LALLGLAFVLSSCDSLNTVTEGFQHAKAVASDLEQSAGVKPQVGFNWHNGRLTQVTVAFPRLYETKPLSELAGLVRAAVTKEFQQEPDNIMLSFALGKES
jgi:hypothetical protein